MKYYTDFLTLEDQIKAEYSALRAWIALNPYWAALSALALGLFLGHFV